MPQTELYILSANAGDVFEILVGLAVFIIWVVASIVGAIKKRQPPGPEEEGVVVFEERPAMDVPPPVPPRLVPSRPVHRKPRPPRTTPVSEPSRIEQPVVAREPTTAPMRRTVGSGAKRGSPVAASVRKLLRPDTIRGGIILSELLQPPLALRPERDSPR